MSLAELSLRCAKEIYGSIAPNTNYIDRTHRLLLGTAATESHFKYRRQGGFSFDSDKGAWGLWQTEKDSVEDNLRLLSRREDIRSRVANFLVGHENIDGLLAMNSSAVLRLIYSWDALAVVMCRLHYFHKRPPIPESLEAQAEYYKIYYNSMLGKGSPEKYIRDWNTFVKGKLYG
jgi:hypothetical protein